MARRGSRKQTTALLNDSLALMRAQREIVDVLRRWHPGSIALAIIDQQITSFGTELATQAPTHEDEP